MSRLLIKFYKRNDSVFLYISPILVILSSFAYLTWYLFYINYLYLELALILFVSGMILLIIFHRYATPIKLFEDGVVFRPFLFKDEIKISYIDINNIIYYKNGHPPSATVSKSFKKAFNRGTKCMNTRPHYHLVANGKDYYFFDGKYTFQYGKRICNKKREKGLDEVLEIIRNKLSDRWDNVYVVK